MRMGNNFLSRIYDTRIMKKIELKSEQQNRQFGDRLTKGDTYHIGDNGKERFFITIYHDGSIELWVKRIVRSNIIEETICALTDYEVNCINQLFLSNVNYPSEENTGH